MTHSENSELPHTNGSAAGRTTGTAADSEDVNKVPDEAPVDVAERPGDSQVSHEHADELADEWGEESFPGSDPPAHY
ncbi:MAG: hypothetical protein GX862_01950 [Leucobacter sp.]|nr:hypothetical protein [Leucobacter sp.]